MWCHQWGGLCSMFERLSIIVPTLNEAQALPLLIGDLSPLLAAGAQLIIADAGSTDGTVALGRQYIIQAPRGRARQMNAGAAKAHGEVLWFVHADTRITPEVLAAWPLVLTRTNWQWGRFDVRLSGRARGLRVIEAMINWRSRFSRIATGDQGIFVRRELFDAIKGFADQPLMEDIALCRTLKAIAPPECRRERLITSSRRWEQRGIVRTVLLMWWLRARYFFGADPAHLARSYR
jgi:rSAM/selenodomain-associated transferase 2